LTGTRQLRSFANPQVTLAPGHSMRSALRLLGLVLSLCFLIASPSLAQEKGSISGKVTDKKTGHALPFATITVVGAQRGGLTDSEGQFLVTGVRVGSWEVKIQFLGYKPESRPATVVTAGKATVVNVAMEDIVVRQEKTVEVTAERKLVDAKQGATIRSVSANEIRNQAVTVLSDVLQQQAGVSTEGDQ